MLALISAIASLLDNQHTERGDHMKTGEYATDCLDPPVEHGDMPDLTAGDSVVLGLHPVGPDLVGSTRSNAMKLLRLRDGQNQLLSGNVAGQRHVCWLRRNSPIRTDSFPGRCGSRATPGGRGWCMGITATAWLAAEDLH